MKTFKKNNKGFSLVELIVVILIMAIIAVALAPQVMKWVDESKISADTNNRAGIKSALDAAVADYMSQGKTITDESFDIDGAKPGSLNSDGLLDVIDETLNSTYPDFQSTEAGKFHVEITSTGKVTVTVTGGKSGEDYQ